MKTNVKDARALFRALGAVDENHFAIVENERVALYDRGDYQPAPMPYGSCVLEIPDDRVVSL